jgi:hypothetical protein
VTPRVLYSKKGTVPFILVVAAATVVVSAEEASPLPEPSSGHKIALRAKPRFQVGWNDKFEIIQGYAFSGLPRTKEKFSVAVYKSLIHVFRILFNFQNYTG